MITASLIIIIMVVELFHSIFVSACRYDSGCLETSGFYQYWEHSIYTALDACLINGCKNCSRGSAVNLVVKHV